MPAQRTRSSLLRKDALIRAVLPLGLILLATTDLRAAHKVSVQQLEQMIAAAQSRSQPDSDLAKAVAKFELSERLTEREIARFPAMQIRTATTVRILAAQSSFLPPPKDHISAEEPLGDAEQQSLFARVRSYASAYTSRMPDFLCTKTMRRFDDDAPKSASLKARFGRWVLRSGFAGELSMRDGKEDYALFRANLRTREAYWSGFTTFGEFGGILSFLLSEENKLSWVRWESYDHQTTALLHYSVDEQHSTHTITWCCDAAYRTMSIRPAVEGEITVNPASGEVLRITREAKLTDTSVVRRDITAVEYEPVVIDGKSYLLPAHGVNIDENLTGGPSEQPHYIVRFINDVEFSSYHQFRTSSRILTKREAEHRLASSNLEPRQQAVPDDDEAILPEASDQTPDLPSSNSDVPTIRTTTRLLQVSVVAQDKHGNPIPNLTADNFELYDNGEKRSFRFFGMERGDNSQQGVAPTNDVIEEEHIYSNRTQNVAPKSLTIVLLDAFNSTMEDMWNEVGALKKFLVTVRRDERIGIMIHDGLQLWIVHDFRRNSDDIAKRFASFNGLSDVFRTGDHRNWTIRLAKSLSGKSSPDVVNMREFMRSRDLAVGPDTLVRTRLSTMEAVAGYLAHIPGRKRLIWLSPGFPLTFADHGGLESGAHQEVLEMERAFNSADVAIYAVTPRSLETLQPDAETRQPKSVEELVTNGVLNQTLAEKHTEAFQYQASLVEFSDATGGRAAINTNDLAHAIEQAANDSRATYALGFYLDNDRFDDQYHKLEVRVVGRNDVHINYRKGYSNAPLNPLDTKQRLKDAILDLQDDAGIGMEAQVSVEDTPLYKQWRVDLNLALGDLALVQQERWHNGTVHVLVVAREDNGHEYQRVEQTLKLHLEEPTYRQMLRDGFAHACFLPIERHVTSIRAIVWDDTSRNLGTITIPVTR